MGVAYLNSKMLMNSAETHNKLFQCCAFLEVTDHDYDRISAEKIICLSDEQRKS